MIELISTVLLSLICGSLDRLRGSRASVDLAAVAVTGIFLELIIVINHGPLPIWQLIITLWFTLGSTFGWGEPLGAALAGRRMNPADLEWWQFGPLKTNSWLALAFRGLMWFPTMAVAMPLGAFVARHLPISVEKRWKLQEFFRGTLNAVLVAVIATFV